MERDVLKVVPEESARAGVLAHPGRRDSFRALNSRPFRRYFAGQVASASGTFLQQTAIGWLVLQLGSVNLIWLRCAPLIWPRR